MNTVYTGALRHVAQALAGALVSKGLITADGQELVIGAVVSAVTLGWYLVSNRTKAIGK